MLSFDLIFDGLVFLSFFLSFSPNFRTQKFKSLWSSYHVPIQHIINCAFSHSYFYEPNGNCYTLFFLFAACFLCRAVDLLCVREIRVVVVSAAAVAAADIFDQMSFFVCESSRVELQAVSLSFVRPVFVSPSGA